jgi:hypothetical protein
MIIWSLLVGVLLVAVLHRLDLAVEQPARSGAATNEDSTGPGPTSPGEFEPSLSDPVHLPVPPASRFAARTRPHRSTPVTVARQLTRRVVPGKSWFTRVRRD